MFDGYAIGGTIYASAPIGYEIEKVFPRGCECDACKFCFWVRFRVDNGQIIEYRMGVN